MIERDVIVIGGGAAGFFAAIACAEANPGLSVTILERGPRVLHKVLISGGGRCNVTHACFEPAEFVTRYPRGKRELLGPFHRHGAAWVVEWFQTRGVKLKSEEDGRIFPVTDNSETIASCLIQAAEDAGAAIRTRQSVTGVEQNPDGSFHIRCSDEATWHCRKLMVATGGLKPGSPMDSLTSLGHSIEPLAPSLFTFHIDDARLADLQGLSVNDAEVSVLGTKLQERGPILVTHWGLSGPAILKISAWGARALQKLEYRFECRINWIPDAAYEEVLQGLKAMKNIEGKKQVAASRPFDLPRRIWERLVAQAGIQHGMTWSQAGAMALKKLAGELTACDFHVTDKSMNKEEFVTCGGVSLKEVDFKTMESRKVANLYFGGEVLDIDGITGGFNFQSAWTTGFIAGQAMAADEFA
ncbi:MAG: aminoacetone oxidase family FAD-binding enzyme [Verrucomicrobiales bacterium]|nr:aminoacetone oxidase family FAD-binding enzyme [Verrucomicrobiales bacterium]